MKNRLGGLARRATYIEGLREAGVPLLHVDAGDAFQNKYTVSDAERDQVRAAVDVFLASFADMGLQGYAIGDRDLALGIDELKKIAQKAKFPLLSANILGKDGKPIFQPSVVVEVGGYRIALIGALTTVFVNRTQREQADGFRVGDPVEAVKAEVEKHAAKGVKLFAVLGHLNDGEIEKVAEASPQVQFVLGGQTTKMQRLLEKKGNAFVLNAYMRGKHVSVLEAFVRNGSLKFQDRDARKSMERRQTELKRQIEARQRSIDLAKKDAQRARSVEYLEKNLVQLKTQLQELELDLEEVSDADPNASFVRWELKGMTTQFADHPATAKRVEKYREKYPDPTKKHARAAPVPPRVGAKPTKPKTPEQRSRIQPSLRKRAGAPK